jgi:hypothetical protein
VSSWLLICILAKGRRENSAGPVNEMSVDTEYVEQLSYVADRHFSICLDSSEFYCVTGISCIS